MSRPLHVTLPEIPDARLRMVWDALALQLDTAWEMHKGHDAHLRIHGGSRTLEMPFRAAEPLKAQTLHYQARTYELLAGERLVLARTGDTFHLNADILSPLARWTSLMLEDPLLPRAADGTLAGASYADSNVSAPMLLTDYIGEVAALIAAVLARPLVRPWQQLAPEAPYAVVTTFDCDGFAPGQPEALRRFVDQHEIARPSLFVMAPAEADRSPYDPRYDPADPALRPLYEISEVGLHSSYLAYHDGTRLAAQKARLEAAVGHAVDGHRSHYLRFGFPYTWGYVAQAGFRYDMTMGFYDLPGHRQGGSQPIPVADPSGRGQLLWSWGVGLMDQHLFFPDHQLAWNEGTGTTALAAHLARLRERGGTLVLDWHVHGLDPEQFPHHYRALAWLLTEARADGAWIGGAGLLLDQYLLTNAAGRLAAQVAMRTVEGAGAPAAVQNAGHYVQGASDASITSVDYIDAGAYSFLASLPPDALRIVDVGCGSGWISHRAPALRQVLCIDIDPNITSRLSRRAQVGSLPQLPLEDQQADLVLCTDVLEHLCAQDVLAAGAEFARISTRYAYLQTPLRERLEDGERHCSACGSRWHVNHHLASHDAASLAQVMPSGWYPHTVTYTGEARILDSSLRGSGGELLGEHPMQGQRFTCASCGHVNEPIRGTADPELAEAHVKAPVALPLYSEVAVLAAREDLVPRLWNDEQPVAVSRSGARTHLPKPHKGTSHSIDFSAPVEELPSISATCLVPHVVVQHGTLMRTPTGTELVTSGLSDATSLYLVFPDQHAAGERVLIHGQVLSGGPAKVFVQAFNWALESCGVLTEEAQGAFRLELPLDKAAYCVMLTVQKDDRIVLRGASVTGPARPLYLYDFGSALAYGHVQRRHRGTTWRWLIPAHGRIWADRPFLAQDPPEGFPLAHRRSAPLAEAQAPAVLKFATAKPPTPFNHQIVGLPTAELAALLPPRGEDAREPSQRSEVAPEDCQSMDAGAGLAGAPGFALDDSAPADLAREAPPAAEVPLGLSSSVKRLLLPRVRPVGSALKRVLPPRYYGKLQRLYWRLRR